MKFSIRDKSHPQQHVTVEHAKCLIYIRRDGLKVISCIWSSPMFLPDRNINIICFCCHGNQIIGWQRWGLWKRNKIERLFLLYR